MIINFLYKIIKLKNKNNDVRTVIKVFDSIQNIVIQNSYDEILSDYEISYYLINNEHFKYKNFNIKFTNINNIPF